MGLLRRLFGPAFDDDPPREEVEAGGHVHAPDAHPDDVVVPKQKRSSRSLLSGEPPAGWRRHASESSGGIWPWSGGDSGGGSFGSGSDGGGGGDGGGGSY